MHVQHYWLRLLEMSSNIFSHWVFKSKVIIRQLENVQPIGDGFIYELVKCSLTNVCWMIGVVTLNSANFKVKTNVG